MGIGREQRFNRRRPCPICGGYDDAPRGKGTRCGGYIGSDGEYAHCSRPELAAGLELEKGGTYAHRLRGGECKCGQTHDQRTAAASSSSSSSEPPSKIVATYDYTDEAGALLHQTVRKEPKRFLQRRPNGGSEWIWHLGATCKKPGCPCHHSPVEARLVLYRLAELVADDADRTVTIVEGEKDADALAAKGYLATCNPMGAGKWGLVAELARKVLAGRQVVIIADGDEVGRSHAREVAKSLRGAARRISVFECRGHKDVSDLLASGAGLGAENFTKLEPTVVAEDDGVAGFAASLTPEVEKEEASEPAVTILRWADIAKPLPPLTYIVKEIGMVDGGGPPHIVAGYGFSGKTLALQSMALSLAAARPIWGAYSCRDARRVVHVDLEQADRLDRMRYQRLAFAMGIGEPEIGDRLELVVLPKIRLVKSDRKAWLDLMTGRSLIIIDSLRAAAPGVDENSSAMREPLDMLLELSEESGCRAAVVVHARKPSKEDNGKSSSARYSIRGSSAIFDGSDGCWVFAAEKGEPVNVSCERVKTQGEPCEDFALVIQDVAAGDDARAGLKVEVRGAEIVKQRREEAARAQRETRVRFDADALRKVLGSQPGLGKNDLRMAMRREGVGNYQRVDDALAALGASVEYRDEKRGRTYVTRHFLRG